MGMAETNGTAEYHGMPPEPGCYEERYRLNWAVAVITTFSLLVIGAAIFEPGMQIPGRVILIAFGAYGILPHMIVLARRKIAFRADHAGITLGPTMFPFPSLTSDVFISWANIKEIRLYKVRLASRSLAAGNYLAIVPPGGTPDGTGADRIMGNWRLDRERLAAVIAVAAPRVSITDTR
jgi:hypothetical protein